YYVYLKEYTECCCSPVGPPNSFAAAAVTAKLLGFNVETTLNAMSISGSLLAMSPMEATMAGSSEKPYMFGGWPASVGIYSALCAKNGMTGTARILEDEMGLLPTWAKNFDLRAVTDGLGEKWILERPRRKIQSCCGYTHSPIDAILSILREDGVSPDDIEKVEITVAPYVYPVIGAKTPANYLAARFCLLYLIAVVMNKMSYISPEDTSPEQFEKFMAGEVGALMDRIEVRTEPGFPHRFSSYPAGCCNVKVTTRAGEEYSRFKEHFKGHQEDPLSESEILDKFRRLAASVFTNKRIEEIVKAVFNLEKMAAISRLIDLTTDR
ncbi:MmgE/PrpD family protein, partial [Chloroflexota bacterium]